MKKRILSLIVCLALLIADTGVVCAAGADLQEQSESETRVGTMGNGDLTRLRLNDVWKHVTGQGVNVAIIDYVGVNPYDPAVRPNVRGVYNARTGSEDWGDGYDSGQSHGTECAKTLLQVAPKINLYIIKISYEKDLISAIRWAQSKKCRVISFSGWTYDKGVNAESDPEDDDIGAEYNAIQSVYTAADNSILLCASSGNTGKQEYHYPSAHTNTLCVGVAAYDTGKGQYVVLPKETHHDRMDVVAPGGATSGATAVAAGMAALLFQAKPSMTARQCHSIVRSTALDLGAKGRDQWYGYGLIQPYKALSKVKDLSGTGTQTVYARSLKLSKTKLDLYMGQSSSLTYRRSPSGSKDKITWTSSNRSVASVDSKGKVQAKNVGEAVITAKTARGVRATCAVDVYPTRVSSGRIQSQKNRRLLATWSRNAKAQGYILQIATNKSFTRNVKEKKITKNKTVKYTFTGLKAGRRYYWRIRTYKEAGRYIYYSGWSSQKTSVLVR